MTSTYSISNIIHIYDDLVNQKMAVTTSLPQSRVSFLDNFITAVLRVIGGAWFDQINVSRIVPQNDQQSSLNNQLTIGQADSKINLESTITHFIINNSRKTLFYASSQNYTTVSNQPIAITIYLQWDTPNNISPLDTLCVSSKLIITDTNFNNGYKESTLLVSPCITSNVDYRTIKENDVSSGDISIDSLTVECTSSSQIAITYQWHFNSGQSESQTILEMEISSKIDIGNLNISTSNIEPPPNQSYNTPNDPTVLTLGTESTKLYIEGANTSMIMNDIQKNMSFLNSVNFIYQDNMRIGAYLEWEYYLVNQPLYSFHVELKIYTVDTAFNTIYKEASLIINPDLTNSLQYVTVKDNETYSESYQVIGLFVEKINYRQVLIYYAWNMLSNEIECQSMIDIAVMSKTGLGNMIITGYSA